MLVYLSKASTNTCIFNSLNDDRTIPARKRILEEEAEKLDERIASLQETRAYLQHKINVYDSQLTQATNDLKLSEE